MAISQIYTDAPLPARKTSAGSAKYPFAELKVNGSFFVELEKGETRKGVLSRLSANARRYAKENEGVKFAFRTSHPDCLTDCVGVWRTQ